MNDTKEKILSIALSHFVRKPYTEVTMSEILKDSGLSKGGFYHHFESKNVLYHQVIDKFILGSFYTEFGHFKDNPYDLSFSEFIPVYIKSTLEHLLELANANLGDLKLNAEEVNLYMIMFDMLKHYNGFNTMLEKLHQSEISMFVIVIDKAKAKGEIRKDIDSELLANMVHTFMHGIGVLEMFEDGQSIEKNIQIQFNNLYQLIKT